MPANKSFVDEARMKAEAWLAELRAQYRPIPSIRTGEAARQLPEGSAVTQYLATDEYGESLAIPVHIGVVQPWDVDAVFRFIDTDGRVMQVVYTLTGAYKEPV